jgi:diaminohydroxyphosphoribosylaminopyrimidine deaminase / 5-amino-6-(5-phosphoribosylamino)uracil reductase
VSAANISEDDRRWMRLAIELSQLCPPSQTAFAVGAIVVDADGNEITRGWSRETDGHVHAEESALAKISADDPRLDGATIYSTLEPCSHRKSRPVTCTQLILATKIPRVVVAWLEPALFVSDAQGSEILRGAGRKVVDIPELADEAREVNAELFKMDG